MNLREIFRPAPGPAPSNPVDVAFVRQLTESLELLQERIAELEQEDIGWQELTGGFDTEFSREGLGRIVRLARVMYLKNPLIWRAVSLQSMYVFGQGVSISAADPDVQAVLTAFMEDRGNRAELMGHQARTLKEVELQVAGNVFLVLFANRASGQVAVRSIPFEEVSDIICNPEDARDSWFYRRKWVVRTLGPDGNTKLEPREAFYPDWQYQPADRPPRVGQVEVRWDSPVYHIKVGGFSNMRFGVSEIYAATDWAKAYKAFLEDWATLVRALSRFAWKATVKGGAGKVAAAKTVLNTTLGSGNGGAGETNPPPVTGGVAITGQDVDLTPMPKTGATTSADDGRRMLLMVAAATGLPESFFGDVSVGTLATAKSLDRPTELKFRDRQALWTDVFRDICQYVIDCAAMAPAGPLRGFVRGEGTDQVIVLPEGEDGRDPRHVDIEFPPILEHDVSASVTAIVDAATLKGSPLAGTFDARTVARMLLRALGEDDIEELLEQLFPDGEQPAPPPPGQGQDGDEQQGEEREGFVEAVRALREAIREMRNQEE